VDAARRSLLPLLGIVLAGLLAGFVAGSAASRPRPAVDTELDAEAMRSEVAEALRVPDTLARAVALERAMARLAPGNVDGAAQAFREVIVSTRHCDMRALMQTWASFEPAASFEYALDLTADAKRRQALMEVSHQWALGGGALEAREYVQSVPGDRTRRDALTGLVRGWVRSGDVDGVTRYVARRPAGHSRLLLTTDIVYAILRREGPEALMRWADGVPGDAPNDFKLEAFRGALMALAADRPDLASTWWESQSEGAWAQDSLWGLAMLWIPQDPDVAMGWLRSLPATETRNEGVRQALRRWFDTERQDALRWMVQNDLPPELRPLLPRGFRQALRRQHDSDPGS
jgi:hypothetical protein